MGKIKNIQVVSRFNRGAASKRTSVLFAVTFEIENDKGEIPSHSSLRLGNVPLPLLQQLLADQERLEVFVQPSHPLSPNSEENLPGGDPVSRVPPGRFHPMKREIGE